ncbi:MAG: DUF4442 domain-containing protein [Acidobacteria bacterium]|nr:DUF4442 domain-containing protein [Acidobacteriota bacterium]
MGENLKMKRVFFRWLLDLYPPYLGAGIRIKSISPDFRKITVQMKLHWYNRNYVGTHFGGSLYSMTDPFYMLMLIKNLGPGYVVWDKAASIEFLKPGTGKMSVSFQLTKEMLESVKKNTAAGQKFTPTWTVDIKNESGEVIAKIRKTLYVRKKRGLRAEPGAAAYKTVPFGE